MPSKESLCTRCIHSQVCCFKNIYLDVIESIESLEVAYVPIGSKESIVKISDISWLQPIVPVCVNYWESNWEQKNNKY